MTSESLLSNAEITLATTDLTSYLKTMGYETTGIHESRDPAAGTSWDIDYQNKLEGLQVSFTLFRQQTIFHLSICKNKEFFYIHHYYKQKQDHASAAKLAKISTFDAPVTQAQLSASISAFVELLDATIRDILTGATWEDICFDYGDYR